MQLKTKQLLVSLVGGGLGVLLLVVGLKSATFRVWADGVTPVGASETGVTPGDASPASVLQAASDWQTVLLDVYDGTYTGTHSIPRTITTRGAAPLQWGRTITGSLGFTDTLWCVQGGEGIALRAGIDTYTDGVDTTVTYGPIDLSHVVTAELQFSHWISVAAGDNLQLGVSTDGVSFAFVDVLPAAMGAWQSRTLNTDLFASLRPLLGQPTVYLAFRFSSNDDGQVERGVFLDNVRLRTNVQMKIYMPIASYVLPPPPKIFVDDFSDPTSGWPRQWKKKDSNINIYGGYMIERGREQLLAQLMQSPEGPVALDTEFQTRFLGDGDEVYYSVVHDAWDRVFVSGPFQVEGDFVFEAKGRYDYIRKSYRGNRYGILVTREKVDPVDPHSVHGHCLYVEINPRSDGGFDAAGWGVKEWYRTNWKGDDNGDEDRSVKGPGQDGSIKSKLGSWNTFRIERRGAKLRFFINGLSFGSIDDTDTGPLYVGLFARHTGSGSTELSYDVLFEWDDVYVEEID